MFPGAEIPGSPGDFRPDIYITNKDSGEAIIVDVTTLFETGPEAFDKARSEMIDKYTPLIDWLKSQDQVSCVSVHAFIVGSLGAWDPLNKDVVRKLGIGTNCLKNFA